MSPEVIRKIKNAVFDSGIKGILLSNIVEEQNKVKSFDIIWPNEEYDLEVIYSAADNVGKTGFVESAVPTYDPVQGLKIRLK